MFLMNELLITHLKKFQVRVIDYGSFNFSKLNYSIMCDLLNLSTNHYTEVMRGESMVLPVMVLTKTERLLKFLRLSSKRHDWTWVGLNISDFCR